MRVLLTGASGFIGAHAARALTGAGWDLRILARPTSDLSGLAGLRYATALGDLTGHGLADACAGVDAVVHLAGLTLARSAGEFRRINEAGTGALAEAAAGAGVGRFLYISSIAAHGSSASGSLLDPGGACRPVSAYGRSKAGGERLALAQHGAMAVQVLRPPVVYGPRDTGLLPFFRFARRGLIPILGRGENRISMIYGPDLAAALVALLRAAPVASPFFHVSDADGPYSWRELSVALRTALGRRALILQLPAAGFLAAAGMEEALAALRRRPARLSRGRVAEMRRRAWVSDNAALTAACGWIPATPLAAGLAQTVVWYRRNGWI